MSATRLNDRLPQVWRPASAWAICLAAIAFEAWLRLVMFRYSMLPLGFSLLLLLPLWIRRRDVLWAIAVAFLALSVFKFGWVLPNAEFDDGSAIAAARYRWVLLGFIFVQVLLAAGVCHLVLGLWDAAESRMTELEGSNRELAAREEEIARQNEELQSQTEELERQSEELRAANEELLRRERTLETLLALSRALSAELQRDETMARVCEALGQLVNGPTSAAAILEHEGDDLIVRCHTGFGPEGIADERMAMAQSFASLVLTRGRTAYIEDVALRPDLRLPRPKKGEPMVSALAVPLRVGGWPVGTLELYSTQKTAWNEEQVALAESLAAQASVSLEVASLFQKIKGERSRLQAVLQALPVGVLIAEDSAGEKMTGNTALAALYQAPTDANFSPAGAIASRRQVYHRAGEPVEPRDLPLMQALRTGKSITNDELEITLPDGRVAVALVNAAPFFDAAGAVSGGVGVLVDITTQKALQRELDTRRREAEEASVRKTRFLAAVSHDIRTPANAISLLAELLRRTAANPALVGEVPQLAREMYESAVSLVSLLGDVLDVARFDSGRIEIQESDVSVGELLAEEYRRFRPLAQDQGVSLEFTPPPEPLRIRSDRIKLSRVVGNLLGNAIKFTPAGAVRLDAGLDGGGWVDIRVSDTGVGIAAEHQQSIFDEFFQLGNPERDRRKGTGLGLAICKRLVDAMGGRLAVRSAPGEGSTFTVSLPPAGVGPTPVVL